MQLLQEEQPQPGFWTFSYYQSFFDVDTSQVRSGKLLGGACHAWGSATLHGALSVQWTLGRLEIHTWENELPPRLVEVTGGYNVLMCCAECWGTQEAHLIW